MARIWDEPGIHLHLLYHKFSTNALDRQFISQMEPVSSGLHGVDMRRDQKINPCLSRAYEPLVLFQAHLLMVSSLYSIVLLVA